MILVTGATGNVGNQVARTLVARGAAVRAIARHPSRTSLPAAVEVIAGDLEAPETLMPALAGIRKVFLLGRFATTELVARLSQAGVLHVVLLTSRSVIGGNPANAITRMWLDAEAAVRGSQIAWTVLRPSGFHSNALRWLPELQRGEVIRAPWPQVPIASIDPADIAAVAATVLTEAGHESTALALSGPQPLTPGDQVATLALVLHRSLRYEPLSDHEARVQMAVDTPAPFIDAFFRFFSAGEFDDSLVVHTVQAVTGHAPHTFEQWAREHSYRFADAARPGRADSSETETIL